MHCTLGQHILFTGNFGDVYSAKLLKDNKEKIDIAIKVVKNLNDQRDRDDFEREQSIMSQMKHPNIVELYGIVYDQGLLLTLTN